MKLKHNIVTIAMLITVAPVSHAASWRAWILGSTPDYEKELKEAIVKGDLNRVSAMTTELTTQEVYPPDMWEQFSNDRKRFITEYAPHLNIHKVGAQKFREWEQYAAGLGREQISKFFNDVIGQRAPAEVPEGEVRYEGTEKVKQWIHGLVGLDVDALPKQAQNIGQGLSDIITGTTEHDTAVDEIIDKLKELSGEIQTGYVARCVEGNNNLSDCSAYFQEQSEYFAKNRIYWESFRSYESDLKDAMEKTQILDGMPREHQIGYEYRLLNDLVVVNQKDDKGVTAAVKNFANQFSQGRQKRSGRQQLLLDVFPSPIRVNAYRRYVEGEDYWKNSYGAPAKIQQAIGSTRQLIEKLRSTAQEGDSSLYDSLPPEPQNTNVGPQSLTEILDSLSQHLEVFARFSLDRAQEQEPQAQASSAFAGALVLGETTSRPESGEDDVALVTQEEDILDSEDLEDIEDILASD